MNTDMDGKVALVTGPAAALGSPQPQKVRDDLRGHRSQAHPTPRASIKTGTPR